MKAKPKKSQSLSLVGGSVRGIHIKIGGNKIPTVTEKTVKSFGRLYSIPLTDRHRDTEVQKVALKELKSIDNTYRCMRLQYLALSGFNSIVTNTCVSGSEFLLVCRKWVYIQILVEEFKIGKVRLHMMMKDSANEVIRKAYPEIKSCTKWSAV